MSDHREAIIELKTSVQGLKLQIEAELSKEQFHEREFGVRKKRRLERERKIEELEKTILALTPPPVFAGEPDEEGALNFD